jgi:hypothetical protein
LQDNRYRNDHRKVFRRTLVVVLHRQDCARAFAHQHHHRGVVEKFLIRSPYLGEKSADRGNGRVCKGIRCTPWGREGVGGEGRCEGPHVRVWMWGQDTRDSEAVQDGRAEVVEGASFWGGVRRVGRFTWRRRSGYNWCFYPYLGVSRYFCEIFLRDMRLSSSLVDAFLGECGSFDHGSHEGRAGMTPASTPNLSRLHCSPRTLRVCFSFPRSNSIVTICFGSSFSTSGINSAGP